LDIRGIEVDLHACEADPYKNLGHKVKKRVYLPPFKLPEIVPK
jgi:hypothetical protein